MMWTLLLRPLADACRVVSLTWYNNLNCTRSDETDILRNNHNWTHDVTFDARPTELHSRFQLLLSRKHRVWKWSRACLCGAQHVNCARLATRSHCHCCSQFMPSFGFISQLHHAQGATATDGSYRASRCNKLRVAPWVMMMMTMMMLTMTMTMMSMMTMTITMMMVMTTDDWWLMINDLWLIIGDWLMTDAWWLMLDDRSLMIDARWLMIVVDDDDDDYDNGDDDDDE